MLMTSLIPPRFEGSLLLASGRQLGFAEYGPASGRPLIWFHGTPGARRQVPPGAREIALERNVRIIAVERPGIGASTPHLYESVRGWAADIEEFCDALELERVAVAGLSGGGPYALACAHDMPERVVTAAVLGGVAPAVGPDKAKGGPSEFSRRLEPLSRIARRPMGAFLRKLIRVVEPLADPAIDLFARFMPPGDQLVFADEAIREMFADDLIRGSRTNMQALFLDAVLFGRSWGFALGDIRVPVHLWYGDADNIVPIEHGHHMARRIPNAVLRVRPDEGHLGGLGASDEILDAVIREWEATG
jgi:pimeloyl-ACP methyl ester carboxylesterase